MNKPRGKPFPPGNAFGRGRPKGSRNKTTPAAQNLLEQHYEALMAKQLKAAYDGDAKARQWCLEEIQRMPAPPRKLKLGPLKTLDDVSKANGVVMKEVAQRNLTIGEGAQVMDMLEKTRKNVETQLLVSRLEDLEQLVKSRRD
jgi:hypothetical protein